MFRRIHDLDRSQVLFAFEGRQIVGRTGDTVAAALFEAGQPISRATAKDGAPRGPFCMMGGCFDCLMVIDGQANRQACQTIIRDGMTVARQLGASSRVVDGGE
ncbi:MAG: (2Fe-2S)-binding protein [Thalassobaculaceae bacterium]